MNSEYLPRLTGLFSLITCVCVWLVGLFLHVKSHDLVLTPEGPFLPEDDFEDVVVDGFNGILTAGHFGKGHLDFYGPIFVLRLVVVASASASATVAVADVEVLYVVEV